MKAMLALLRACSWPHFKRHWLRTLLELASVTLAVLLFVSLRTLENSLLVSFEKTIQAFSGGADLSITHGIGIESEALDLIEQMDGLRAAPIIERSAFAPDINQRVVVLGIDFIRDARLRGVSMEHGGGLSRAAFLLPRKLIVSRDFAERHGFKPGSTLRLQTASGIQDFRIAGFLPEGEAISHLSLPVMVLNIRSAQHCFHRRGRYDRIDVRLEGATADEIGERLGAPYLVQPLLKTNPVLEYQLQQFELLLNPITMLALLTAIFLIQNSMYLSVVERIHDLSVLRAVGADRSQTLLLIFCEALAMGVLAAALGSGLGLIASRLLLKHTVASASLVISAVDVSEITVPPDALALGVLIGVGAAVVGALMPAWLAFRVPPAEALAEFQPTERRRVPLHFQLFMAAGVFLAASLSGQMLVLNRRWALIALVLGYSSIAFAMPALVIATSRLLSAVAARLLRIEGHLALDNIVSFPSRTGLTVVAFSSSLSIVVAVAGCLLTLDTQVMRFVTRVTPYDLVLHMHDPTLGVETSLTFPGAVQGAVAQLPEVAAVCGVRNILIPYEGDWLMLAAYDGSCLTKVIDDRASAPEASLEAELERGGVAASSNFAHFHHLSVGDTVNLLTPVGNKSFRIVHIVEDYAWPRGTLLLDRHVYRSLWKDDSLTYLHVAARSNVSVDELSAAVLENLSGQYQVSAFASVEVRAAVSQLLHQWFRLADAQIIVAQVVGAIGIANTVLISLLTRRRQLALLLAIGASSWQIYAALAWEAAILGSSSALIGIALGLWQMCLPAKWAIEAETGYRLAPVVPWHALMMVFLLGVLISLLASLVPIYYARRTDLKAALAYE